MYLIWGPINKRIFQCLLIFSFPYFVYSVDKKLLLKCGGVSTILGLHTFISFLKSNFEFTFHKTKYKWLCLSKGGTCDPLFDLYSAKPKISVWSSLKKCCVAWVCLSYLLRLSYTELYSQYGTFPISNNCTEK